MKWFGTDDEGRMWVAGLPVSGVWYGDSDALLDGFEPENPSLVVPRKFGLGWSLNLGALAVKAGWIRPDDSLPDLADHIPVGLRRSIAVAPLVGGALTVGMSVAVAKQQTVASKYSLTGKPVKFVSGPRAVIAPVVLPGIVALLPRLTARSVPQSQAAIDVSCSAETFGTQVLAVATLGASYRSAKQPGKRQLLAVAAPLLWLIVSGGVQVACVKTALNSINTDLRARDERRKEA